MKWKDILFFNRKDKIAISILSCLGFILSSAYVVYPLIKNDNRHKDKSLHEFSEFQKNLTPIYHSAQRIDSVSQPTHQFLNKNKLNVGQRIDLNSANEKALKKVPGIGDTFAKRIIEHRTSLGGFTNIEQLMDVKGMSPNKYEKINSFFIIEKEAKK